MSKKRAQYKLQHILCRAAVAAAVGVGLTVALMAVGAWLLLVEKIGENAIRLWLLTAVFLGCVICAMINGNSIQGCIPCVFMSSAGYLMLITIPVIWGASMGDMAVFGYGNIAAILAGSTIGSVTNLVKSNKSYINKSKWKR